MRVGWYGLVGMVVSVGAILILFKLLYPTFYRDSGSPPLCIALPIGIPLGLILGRLVDRADKPSRR